MAVTLIGLALRLSSVGDALFGDELSTYHIVTGHGPGTILHLLNGHGIDVNPPAYYLLARLAEKVLGSSAESLRLPSLLAGTATIPLTYVLARQTVGRAAGFVASTLVALSPFLIFYSTEARAYALLVLVCLLSTLTFVRALRTARRGWWAAYAACSCIAAYTHYTAVFLLAAQLAWGLLTQPRARPALLIANGAAAIAFLPWLPSLINSTHSPGSGSPGFFDPFGLHAIRVDLGRWSIGHPYLTQAVIPGTTAALLLLAGVVITLLGGALALIRGWRRQSSLRIRVRAEVALVVVLAGADPVLIALYSSIRESVWGARNIIASWPGFAVLMGALLTCSRPRWRVPAVALVLAGYALGGFAVLADAHHRPAYQHAVAYITHTSQGGPAVELPLPTPGPPTALEAAFALDGSAARHPVLRLGLPPIAAVLRAPAYAALTPPQGHVIAREAAAIAGDGFLFIVRPFAIPISALEHARGLHVKGGTNAFDAFGSFLAALPARFHPVAARTFPGFVPITVYVYRG